MATTVYGVNHPLAVKVWSKAVAREALKITQFGQFMSKDTDSLIVVKEELNKSAGDTVYVPLAMIPTGDGVQGDGTLQNNEEALTTYRDALIINQLRHAMKSDGKMSEQRTLLNLREEFKIGLAKWWADRFDAWCANQAAGNTTITDTRYTGNNATISPSSTAGNTRAEFGNGTCTTENSVSTCACYITLDMIDRCINVAETCSPAILPANTPLGRFYVMMMHPNQEYRLRTDATAGAITWFNLHQAMLQGGQPEDESPIIQSGFHGFIGMYNNTLLYVNSRMPVANSTTACRRAVFMGAGALIAGFGQGYGMEQYDWVEAMDDYENQFGVACGLIGGVKKTVFNSIDYATIALTTYAPNP